MNKSTTYADCDGLSRKSSERGCRAPWWAFQPCVCYKNRSFSRTIHGLKGRFCLNLKEDAHLLLFAVRTAHRRIGVGSAVLTWLEAVARTAGTQRIVVEARLENAAARSFYSEHGYHERAIEKAMYGRVVDGVRLEKWLLTDA